VYFDSARCAVSDAGSGAHVERTVFWFVGDTDRDAALPRLHQVVAPAASGGNIVTMVNLESMPNTDRNFRPLLPAHQGLLHG